MPAVIEARTMLCAVPVDTTRGESRGVWLSRAARLLAITPSVARGIYYQKKKRIDADTYLRMRDRLDELKERADANRTRINDLIHFRHAHARAGDAD